MDDTRLRILNAAGPIFAEKGFAKATIREICHAAEVNLAGVNYHFGDKERLYIETVKAAHQMRAAQVPLPDWNEGTPVAVKLEGLIRTLVRRFCGLGPAPWQIRLMMRETTQPTEACRELVEDYFRPHFEKMISILNEALPNDTPSYTRRMIGFSIIGQCVYYRLASHVVSILVPPDELEEQFDVEGIADHIVRFTLSSLGLQPPLGDLSSHSVTDDDDTLARTK